MFVLKLHDDHYIQILSNQLPHFFKEKNFKYKNKLQ